MSLVLDNETGQVVSAVVQTGREAWQRIRISGKKLREDWLMLAAALDVGRKACTPEGKGLNKKAFGQWCEREGFGDLDNRQRAESLWLLDNQDYIFRNPEITANNPGDIHKEYLKIKKQKQTDDKRKKKSAIPDLPPISDRYKLYNCSCAELARHIEPGSQDWIITDPPYPREYLNVFSELSVLACQILKPGGLLICMSGQSYLPEVIARLGERLDYHWCCAYLTLGESTSSLFVRRVNTFWKPVLIFSKGEYKGHVFGDVCKSEENDKKHHKWGQSVSGMTDIVNRFTMPGDTVVDPFLGGGTTCIASIENNRMFIGCDIDSVHIDTTLERLTKCLQ